MADFKIIEFSMDNFEQIIFKRLLSHPDIIEYNRDIITLKEITEDINSIKVILSDTYKKTDFNTFLYIFTEACILCIKYNIISINNDTEKDFIINEFLCCSKHENCRNMLIGLANAIFNLANTEDSEENLYSFFINESNSINNYDIIHLYRFIYYAKKFFYDTDDYSSKSYKKKMLETYSMLPEELQKHVSGKKVITSDINSKPAYPNSLLPYLCFEDIYSLEMKYLIKFLKDIVDHSLYKEQFIEDDNFFDACFREFKLQDKNLSSLNIIFNNGLEHFDNTNIKMNVMECGFYHLGYILMDIIRLDLMNKNKSCHANRLHMINIPCIINSDKNISSLFDAELMSKENKEIITKQRNMVFNLSHSAKNYNSFDILYDIIELLNDENPDDINFNDIKSKLNIEYSNIIALIHNIEMLHMEISDDGSLISELEDTACNDASEPGLAELLNQSARFFLVSLFFSEGRKIKSLRDFLSDRLDLKKLMTDFTSNIAFKEDTDAFVWMTKKMLNITILDISQIWNKLHIYRDEASYFFFINLFSETIKNFFQHANIEKEIQLKFIDTNDFLVFEFNNYISEKKFISSGNGLKGIESIINVINNNSCDSIFVESSSNTYNCKIMIKKHIFIKD